MLSEMTIAPAASQSWAASRSRPLSIPRLIILLFLVAQAWDGIFTYTAVHAFGIAAEGNAIVATWMHLIGPTPALIGAKVLAILCGVLLYVRGVHHALAGLTVLYSVAALGPWLVIFSSL
jgi:hypothetical protein